MNRIHTSYYSLALIVLAQNLTLFKTMKILVNCINLLGGAEGAGGAGSYIYSLIVELAKLETVRVLVKVDNLGRFQKINDLQVIPLIDNNIKLIHENLSWADIYFCPLNELVPQYIDSRVPVVSTILDLQHEVYPHYFKSGVYEGRRVHYGYAIARANGILTISNNEKTLIQKIYNKKDVYVTYLSGYLADQFSTEEAQTKLEQNQLELSQSPYIIYPAIPWRHKNHHRLIEALWMLKRERKEFKDLKLILTGAEHSLSSSSLQHLINALQMQDSIEIKGFVSDLDLATLIKNAKLMVFPSLYEGFGIPIIDAMKLGTPVLTTYCAAISEVSGEAVVYMQNPLNSKQIANDLYSLLINSEKLDYLSQSGKVKSEFYSSEKTAKSTLSAFQDILEKHKNQPKLDYINVNAVPQYRHISKQAKLSLILDCSNWINSEKDTERLGLCIDEILSCYNNDFKIIPILSNQSKLKSSDSSILPVYYLQENESYFNNLLDYIFDSVVETEYVIYSSMDKFLSFYKKLNISEALTILDTFNNFIAVQFTQEVTYPTDISPLSGIKLLQKYDQHKHRRLEFFELTLLRANSQNKDNHLGQFKFLSNFLSQSYYLKYPIR